MNKIKPHDIAITDDDIRWAENLLSLPLKALDGERADAIKTMQSIDIQSCPGSGKTTLLVAKLAILSRKINSKTQGICVLSHTNVARQEVEKKLGKHKEGQSLLGYPNYIGTIHSFLYEFIALPWVRSKGWPIKIVESQIVKNMRIDSLPSCYENDSRVNSLINANFFELISLPNELPIASWGRTKTDTKDGSRIRKIVERIIQQSHINGHFTYDELLLFAQEAINTSRLIQISIVKRFPVIFIDEAQDNSELQNSLLNSLFPFSNTSICRQRFGDGNQAIYHSYTSKAVSTSEFPSPNFISIGSSKRLSCEIARLSDPLGLVPYDMQGTKECEIENKHTIFIYNDDTILNVLPAFGDLILECANDTDLPNYAVGMVHKLDRANPIGANVQHYWNDYSPEHSKRDPFLDNFIDYVHYAKSQITSGKPLDKAVNILSKGIIIYINKYVETDVSTNQNKSYRRLINFINDFDSPIMLKELIHNILQINNFNNKLWVEELIPTFLKTLNNLHLGVEFKLNDFLEWKDVCFDNTIARKINIYTHIKGDKSVEIRLGSIHSVKGQTHFATLVLDTFYYGTNLGHIIDWITGKKSGKGKANITNIKRLKCHYVGMTRPTSLLCLAIHNNQVDDVKIKKLKDHGWHIDFV